MDASAIGVVNQLNTNEVDDTLKRVVIDYFEGCDFEDKLLVDLRPTSETFLDHAKIVISEENRNILFIPKGFAHGYITTIKNTLISYKIDNIYSPNHQQSIHWQDESLGIKWPKFDRYFLSTKDRNAKKFNELNIS